MGKNAFHEDLDDTFRGVHVRIRTTIIPTRADAGDGTTTSTRSSFMTPTTRSFVKLMRSVSTTLKESDGQPL